eukprot:gene26156-biopygen14460
MCIDVQTPEFHRRGHDQLESKLPSDMPILRFAQNQQLRFQRDSGRKRPPRRMAYFAFPATWLSDLSKITSKCLFDGTPVVPSGPPPRPRDPKGGRVVMVMV